MPAKVRHDLRAKGWQPQHTTSGDLQLKRCTDMWGNSIRLGKEQSSTKKSLLIASWLAPWCPLQRMAAVELQGLAGAVTNHKDTDCDM